MYETRYTIVIHCRQKKCRKIMLVCLKICLIYLVMLYHIDMAIIFSAALLILSLYGKLCTMQKKT